MKKLLGVSLIMLYSIGAHGSHITGGEMFYRFLGMNGSLYRYSVTMKLFQRCESGRVFPNPTIISIFDKTTNFRYTDLTVPIANTQNIRINNPDPCITNPPNVCYDVAYYNFEVNLPASSLGYIMASQVNFRIAGITNLAGGYNNVGATYTAEIPGVGTRPDAPQNHSAEFTGSDLVIICANNDFSYSFAARDDDGDELRYFFCEAYASTNSNGGTVVPTNPPPFPSVPYGAPFNETAPLGPGVTVNPTTGMITGVAPPGGIYVVTVCVEEVRGGVIIARQRKDIQINIAYCDIASASLLPDYSLCKTTQTITLFNQSTSPLINTTDWEFYDGLNNLLFTTTGYYATYTFPGPGDYRVKLFINRGQACYDTTETIIHVWPGFEPAFDVSGICVSKPTFFTDQTTSVFGVPNSWTWDLGEPSVVNDISTAQNPTYTYPGVGLKRVRLIVTDTKGCRDTAFRDINIIEKPPISLAFKDTLICVNDDLTLQASGSGIFSWSPLINIINPNTATPTVSPLITTTYYVDLDDNGCKNRDSVRVRVVDHVTLAAMPDTLICRGDTIQLHMASDGLLYSWTPVAQVINPTVKDPLVFTPNVFTDYTVTAMIGSCSSTDVIRVNTVAYPVVNAGPDQSICYNTKTQLHGSTDGSSWSWTPAQMVNNPVLLDPLAFPPRTTDFVLSAWDTKGCPKPGRDIVKVTVYPKMNVSAGADTSVITGQPLQLNATGAEAYSWSPGLYLSATNIGNPVAVFPDPNPGIQYKIIGYDANGCADSAYLTIKVFKTGPSIFVPTAFTPNNDGRNDLLRPIAVGMKSIDYFNIYNRWGQLIFTTSTNGYGWDGKISGQLQTSGTFVWSAKATDYLGKSYFNKGTFTLIR